MKKTFETLKEFGFRDIDESVCNQFDEIPVNEQILALEILKYDIELEPDKILSAEFEWETGENYQDCSGDYIPALEVLFRWLGSITWFDASYECEISIKCPDGTFRLLCRADMEKKEDIS